MNLDKDGYRLLEENFESRGFIFEFIQNLENGWKIYKKTSKSSKNIKYELIKPIKYEEGTFHGKLLPKRYSYPGDSAFGHHGFDCISIDRCIQIYQTIIAKKTAEENKIPVENLPLKIPSNKTFTKKDILNLNPEWTEYNLNKKIHFLLENNIIIKYGEQENKKGKPSILYKKK